MKRIILSIFVLISGEYAFADEHKESKTRYYRHEMNVSWTGMILPRRQWADYENKVYQTMTFELDHDSGSALFGPSSNGVLMSYYYHLNHRIAVGTMTGLTMHNSSLGGEYRVPVETTFEYLDSKEHIIKKTYGTEYKNTYISGGKIKEKSFFLMPSLKWSWLNNSWCSLYMKASIGLHYQQLGVNTEEIPQKSNENLDECKLWFAFIATPLGLEIGKQKVRGFFELGFGSNTNLQIGFAYRWGRY